MGAKKHSWLRKRLCVSLSSTYLEQISSLSCPLGTCSALGKPVCPRVVFIDELEPSHKLSPLAKFSEENDKTKAQRLWKRICECKRGRLDSTNKAAMEDPRTLSVVLRSPETPKPS